MKKILTVFYFSVLILTLLALPVFATLDSETTPVAPDASLLASPGEVFVDGSFDTDTPGWGSTHFDSIEEAAAAVAAGGMVHVAAGTYGPASIGTPDIVIMGHDQVILDGDGLTVDAGLLLTGPGITVENILFRNWNGTDGTAAIVLTGGNTAHQTTIRECRFEDNHYGIRVWTNENQIQDNVFQNSYYHALEIHGDGNQIENNETEDSRYSGIWIEGSYNHINANFLSGNNNWNAGTWLGAITVIGTANTVTNNEAVDNGRIGIYILGNDNIIEGNEASRNGTSGGWRGIHLYGSHNEVLNNTVNHNNSSGIELSYSDEYPSAHNLFQGNTLLENRDNGLYLRGGNTTVIGNRSSGNGSSGMRILSAAAGSIVIGNVCDYNGDYGIDSRGGNQIIGNTVRYNEREESDWVGGGIVVGADDTVYFNNIYGNNPYGVMTWLGAPETGSVGTAADLEPLDARNNWWGHPDGPVVIDLILPSNLEGPAQEQGDTAGGMLVTSPWLAALTLSADTDTLTVGQNQTLTVSLLNSAGEAVGSGPLSVRINVIGSSGPEEIVHLHDGLAEFTYRKNTAGTDTIHLALYIAGEPTGLTTTVDVLWEVGDTVPGEEPAEELPATGTGSLPAMISFLLLTTGLVLRKKEA